MSIHSLMTDEEDTLNTLKDELQYLTNKINGLKYKITCSESKLKILNSLACKTCSGTGKDPLSSINSVCDDCKGTGAITLPED